MSRGGWLVVAMAVLLIITASVITVSLIDDPRNIWSAGLFVLGALAGASWDGWRKHRSSRRDGGEG